MRWLSLGALSLLGLLVPLVLLYVLKVRRTRRRVASTWLWREVERELSARSPWKRLVPQLPLFLQLLALTLLALAAARPATTGHVVSGDHLAIVIDTSASMGAVEGGHTRLEDAKRVAGELVDSLLPGAEVMILDAGREPRLALAPDRDRRRMHAAIDGLVVRDVEGDLSRSVALATERLGQSGGSRRIHVVTDGALASAVSFPSSVPIDVVKVGHPMDNAAIVRVDVRSGDDPVLHREQVQAFLLIANHGQASRELFVTMKQRGASDTLSSRRIVVSPGERVPVILTFLPSPGDRGSGLVFEIAPHDALVADDVAFAQVPRGRKLPVVLASHATPSPWLERVLASDAEASVKVASLPLTPASLDDEPFVVVDHACPPELPGGDVWIVNPPEGECFGVKVGAVLDKPQITSWDQGDERLRFLSFDEVFIAKAHALGAATKRQELVRADLGTLIADASTATRQVTVSGFDVADSDWPYKASFVVFARNLLEQARLHRTSEAAGSSSAGEALRVHVPLGVTNAEVTAPNADGNAPLSLAAHDGLLVVPEAMRVGFYRVEWHAPKEGGMLVPVNLASAAESDLRRTVDASSGAERVADAHTATAAPKEHAHWLALMALAFVLFDLWWYTRGARSRADVSRQEVAR